MTAKHFFGWNFLDSIILGPTTIAEFAVISHEKDFFLSEYKGQGRSNKYYSKSDLSLCLLRDCYVKNVKVELYLGGRGKGGFLFRYFLLKIVAQSLNIFLWLLAFHNYRVIVVLWIWM